MARWDKFLEGMSQGYGTGYQRGREFLADQRRRDLDAVNEEIGGILTQTNDVEGVIPSESVRPDVPQMSPVTPPANSLTGEALPMSPAADPLAKPVVTQETPIQLRGQITGPQTRSQLEQLKKAMARKYELAGDTEGLMNLENYMTKFQQDRILRNLDEASTLIGRDPEAAAQLLHNAYGYYPDGRQAMFTMRNGELYGYGFDEETGKFTKGVKLDADAIANMAEQIRDPQAFAARLRAEKLAAEQTAYQRMQDRITNRREDRKVAIDEEQLGINKSEAEWKNFGRYAAGIRDLYGVDPLTGIGRGGGTPSQQLAQAKWVQDTINEAHKNVDLAIEKGMLTPLESFVLLGDENVVGPGYTSVMGGMADIATNNLAHTGSRLMGEKDIREAAVAAHVMEVLTGSPTSKDLPMDEKYRAMAEEIQSKASKVTISEYGTLTFELNGQEVHLSPARYPNLYRAALIEMGRDPTEVGLPPAVEHQTATDAPRTTTSGVVDEDRSLLGRAGRAAGQVYGAARDVTSQAIGAFNANKVLNRFIGELDTHGSLSTGAIDAFSALPPQEQQLIMDQLPRPAQEMVRRQQALDRRRSGSAATMSTGSEAAIPGV